jgi:lipoteichoic acid synthase
MNNKLKTNTFLQKLSKYRLNLSFFLLIVCVLYLNFYLFFNAVDRPLSLDYLPAVYFNASTAFLLALLYLLRKRNKNFVIFLLFSITLYLLSNVLYFRTYYSILPIDSIKMASNLMGLKDSITSSFRPTDLFFILPTLLLSLFYYFFFKTRLQLESKRYRINLLVIVLVFVSSVIGKEFYVNRNNPYGLFTDENDFRYDVIEGTSSYGFLCCWAWQMNEFFAANLGITPKETAKIEQWFSNHKHDHHVVSENKGRNVILLIVESFESFPIEKKLEGREITPCVNKILREEACLYANHVVPQVKGGRSSDAQLMINSGLLPMHSGAACFRKPQNSYKTLAKALKERNYKSYTLLGGNASFWNQGIFNKLMGYDQLIAIDQFRDDESFEFGLTDSTFLSQAADKICHLPQPYLAQLITLSSHAPFELLDNRVYFQTPLDCPKELAQYLNAIHYVDKCIGKFVADLKMTGQYEKATLIITGDHDAFNHKPHLSNKYGKKLLEERSYDPFIVLNAGISKRHTTVLGQIDLYPTRFK